MDKVLTVLSETSGGVSIISRASVIEIPSETISSSFTLVFSSSTGIIKRLLKKQKKRKKTHSKIIMIAKSKLNLIAPLMSQTLIDLDITHEELKRTVDEKEKYDQMKESVRNKKDKKDFSENA